MNTKVCKKCGIEKEFSEFLKKNRCINGIGGTCKVCEHEYKKKYNNKAKIRSNLYYKNNKDKILLKQKNKYVPHPYKIMDEELRGKDKKEKRKKWIELNKTTYKESQKKYSDKFIACGKNKIKLAKQKNELYNCYITYTLKQKGFTKDQITPELIEVQRLIIKTKRLCKTSQTSEQV